MRVVAFSTTMGGMCVFALMIGIISDFIGEKVDDLKKGKSRVIESGHTLMLGWSDMSLAIIQQIALANESENGGVIVVLAKNDKEDMETELTNAMDAQEGGLQLKGTEVIFRSGNTLAEHDLNKASVQTARSIVALSEGKTISAAANLPPQPHPTMLLDLHLVPCTVRVARPPLLCEPPPCLRCRLLAPRARQINLTQSSVHDAFAALRYPAPLPSPQASTQMRPIRAWCARSCR